MTELVATIVNQFSPEVAKMRADLALFRTDLQSASKDIDAFGKAGAKAGGAAPAAKGGAAPERGGAAPKKDPTVIRGYKRDKLSFNPNEDVARRVAADQKEAAKREAAEAKKEASAKKEADRKAAAEAKAIARDDAKMKREQAAKVKAANKAAADFKRASDKANAARQKESDRIAARDAKAEEARAGDAKPGPLTRKPGAGARLVAAGAAGGAQVASQLTGQLRAAALMGAGFLGARELGSLALGYRGVERLMGITARARLNFRQLFRGIEPKPLLDTIERVSLLFSRQTVAGRALGGLLERSFNGLFGSVKGNEPFILDFLKGLVLGALRLETAWLSTRVALYPLTSALGRVFNIVGVGAAVGQAAVGLLAAKFVSAAAGAVGLSTATLGAVAPFVALAVAAAAAYNAIKSVFDEQDRAATKSVNDESKRLNLISKAKAEQRKGGITEATRKELEAEKAALTSRVAAAPAPVFLGGRGAAGRPAPERTNQQVLDARNLPALKEDLASISDLASAAGASAGKAMGDGVVAGMKAAEAGVSAGGKGLAKAADAGVKSEAQIRSPSRKMRGRGVQMGQGVEQGIREQAAPIQRAAEESLVPDIGGAMRGSGRGAVGLARAVGPVQIGPFYFPNYLGDQAELLAAINAAIDEKGRALLAALGLDDGATT